MAKAILLFIVLSQAGFSILGYFKYSNRKATREEKRRDLLAIKIKDYFLSPVIVLACFSYCLTTENPLWVSFHINSELMVIGTLLVVAGFVLKLLAHIYLGPNWLGLRAFLVTIV